MGCVYDMEKQLSHTNFVTHSTLLYRFVCYGLLFNPPTEAREELSVGSYQNIFIRLDAHHWVKHEPQHFFTGGHP